MKRMLELKKICEDSIDAPDGTYCLSTNNCLVLINAIIELQKENDRLEEEIEHRDTTIRLQDEVAYELHKDRGMSDE